MDRPPRLLFFTYAFPPARAIGAVRCWNIAKHLARHGWDVEVVTIAPELLADPQPSVDVRADCMREKIRLRPTGCDWCLLTGGWLKIPPWQPRSLARIARRAADWAGIDPTAGWISASERACESLRPGDVDAVFVSAPPYTGFVAAAHVARRLQAPLVLDYRDLWSLNPHYTNFASKKIRRREAKLLAAAQGVTVVSPSMAGCLRREFNFTKPLEVVTNGYDTEEFEGISPERFDDFAVVYAGRFYPPGRIAHPMVAAVAQANAGGAQKRPVRLHYFGSDGAHVEGVAAELGAGAWVVNHGIVPRKKVLAALLGANVAAVITTVEATATKAELGILTGKLFEALGARVPVLLISPSASDASRVIRENNLGAVFVGSETEAMARWLVQLRDEEPGVIGRSVDYSWPQLSTRLDDLFRGLIAEKK